MRRAGCLILLVLALAGGCATHPKAQNPFPGVFRVAVVDFSDKTNGAPGVDTNKLTEIFASELQKIPTYEVVPVHEVREVLGPARLDTNQPQLAFELARAVHAQAIIVGSINEYSAHYPPRLALHCEMYAMVTGQPEAVVVSPPIEVEKNRQPLADLLSPLALPAAEIEKAKHKKHCHGCGKCAGCKHGGACTATTSFAWNPFRKRSVVVEEIAEDKSNDPAKTGSSSTDSKNPPEEPIQQMSAKQFTPTDIPKEGVQAPAREATTEPVESVDEEVVSSRPGPPPVDPTQATTEEYLRGEIPDYRMSVRQAIDPIPVVEPWVVRHSRVFDGTHHGLTKKLKDYYFFNDDLRGGDWQGYMLRNEDFVRFACNQMIFEMLDAAGGDWKTMRGVRLPKPWLPWPPR